ncbi:WW domain binding protein VOPP1-like [Ptychodera flava]|uniref:WW domain binding protein VOPP1-like n=1 Tax=Ptychodera flava TaxID=63121 RepID=UPI00396A6AB7
MSTKAVTLPSLLLLSLQVVETKICYHYNSHTRTYTTHICASNQDCCGNSCCNSFSVYHLWYFWFCLIVAVVICGIAGGVYYRNKMMRERNRVRTVSSSIQNTQVTVPVSIQLQPPPYPGTAPPPSYSQTMIHPIGLVPYESEEPSYPEPSTYTTYDTQTVTPSTSYNRHFGGGSR